MSEILHDVLYRIFGDGTPIRYIQIGGNDGIHMDPLYPLHVYKTFKFEWGQVYEPIPEYYSLLERNLSPFSYIHCHQYAVDGGSERSEREFSYVAPEDIEEKGLPGSSKGIGSFSRERNALGGVGYHENKFNMIKDHIRSITVKTLPIGEVVEQFSSANLLLTDCEGYDVEIISAMLERTEFRPKVLQFEVLGDYDGILGLTLERLEMDGYRIFRSSKDLICELQ